MATTKREAGAGRGLVNPGKSGYSKDDEKAAASYDKMLKAQAREIMGRSGSVVRKPADVENATAMGKPNYLNNTRTETGRKINAANVADAKSQLALATSDRKRSAAAAKKK